MSEDKVTVWGGVPRIGRSPVAGDLLIGDGPSSFTLGGGAYDNTGVSQPTIGGKNMEVTLPSGVTRYGYAGYHGSYITTTNLTNSGAGATNLVYYDSSPVSQYGFSVVTNGTNLSRITAAYSGVYNLQFSGQLITNSGGANPMLIWIRINGTDVDSSNTEFSISKNNSRLVAAWNWMVPMTAGQYIEIAWASADAAVLFSAVNPATYGPAIPSMIATIQLVR